MSSGELFKSIEMVRRKLTLEQLSECREAFDLYDDDNDGIITTDDLVRTMRALGYNPNSVILDRIKTIDAVSEDAFIDLVCQQIRYSFTRDDILEDFMVIDVNGDGRITSQELRHYLESLQLPFSEEEIEGIVDEADLNNDGTIDYKELLTMLCLD